MTANKRVVDPRISEAELRRCLSAALTFKAEERGARVLHEYPIEYGAARVDVALVSDRLEAFELKSDFDDFGRLYNQIHAYNRLFDRITLVTGSMLCEIAQTVIPSWWGIATAHRAPDGALTMEELRTPQVNPAQNCLSLAMCLWKEEAEALVTANAAARPASRATKAELHAWIAANLSVDTIRCAVTQQLLRRPAPTTWTRSAPNDGSSHPDASCSDFHSLA